MSSTTVVIEHTSPIPNLGGGRKEVARALINMLEGFTSGAKKGANFEIYANDSTPVAASGTITLASATAGMVVEINGVPFVAVSGTPTSGNNEFDISGTDTAAATSLAASINASTSTGIQYIVTASSALGVVTVTATQEGAQSNAVTIRTGGIRANGTVTYSSSSGAQTITINGVTAYSGTGASDSANAAAAVAAINAHATALVSSHVRALQRSGVVYIYSLFDGAPGNAVTLAASGTGATASVSRLAGGTEASSQGARAAQTIVISGADGGNYTATINGTSTGNVAGTNGDDTATAASIAAAINGITTAIVAEQVFATASSGTVTVTALRGGPAGNAITLAATGTGATATGARLVNGAVPTTVVLSAARLTSGVGGSVTEVAHTF